MANTNTYAWPIGWMISYRTTDCGCPAVADGVIAGPAELRDQTGRVLVPVRPATAPVGTLTHWVPETEIIVLTPGPVA